MAVGGVAQSQVNPAGGFDLATGLKSLMRQDPDVILVGEIRDADTAFTAFQAALTGHLVLSTLHAGSAASGLARLIDMGLEPYILRSGLRALLNQRLLRQLCDCASDTRHTDLLLGLPIASARIPRG
jgi:type II secretory ATPase GspE/PulE/Tfp pilus assembly ATPase PilB-like protein